MTMPSTSSMVMVWNVVIGLLLEGRDVASGRSPSLGAVDEGVIETYARSRGRPGLLVKTCLVVKVFLMVKI